MRTRLPLFLTVSIALAGLTSAQTSGLAEKQWTDLQALLATHSVAPAVVQLIQDADRLKSFYSTFPSAAQAKDAKCGEALLLLRAAAAGDISQGDRRAALVAEIRRDVAIPTAERAEVAATADHLPVILRADLSRPQQLAAFEQVVRGLIAEFPGLPNGYESLVQLAKSAVTDNDAQRIARDVLTMAAPAELKAEAQALLNRYTLPGKSLRQLADPILGANNPVARAAGKPIVVYSWTSQSAASVILAQSLAAKAPAGVVLIGVCLDARDLQAAQRTASAAKLPGEQVYDWLGRRGELAEKLAMIDPGLVYTVSNGGFIQSVSAQRDLAAAFKSNL